MSLFKDTYCCFDLTLVLALLMNLIMLRNEHNKTKEIVFHRPNPMSFHYLLPVDSIKRVTSAEFSLCYCYLCSAYYYRAMHEVLARYCYRMSSVCLSVCLSLTLMYAEHLGWTSSELITPIISLGSSLLGATHRQSSAKGTPLKFGWNRDGVVLSR